MFTPDKKKEGKVFVNPVQESPQRLSIYAINKCEDQVIGFEFISNQYTNDPTCTNNILINLCVPIEVVTPIEIESAEFWVTDDPCFKDWLVKKIAEPDIEIQRDTNSNAIGIVVRFSQYETCCYPSQAAFRLYGFDDNGCKYTLSSGLIIFR